MALKVDFDFLLGKLVLHNHHGLVGQVKIDIPTSSFRNLVIKRAAVINATVSNKALTSNVATLTTSADHGFTTGQSVNVSGVDTTFNGTWYITGTPTTTTFTYARTAGNVASQASTGAAAASNNLTEWWNASDGILTEVAREGYIHVGGLIQGFSTSIADLSVNSSTGSMWIKRTGSLEANLAMFNDTNGSGVQFRALDAGGVRLTDSTANTEMIRVNTFGLGVGSNSPASKLDVRATQASQVAVMIRAAATTPGNITEWQNSSGTILSLVNSAGSIGINATPTGTNFGANFSLNTTSASVKGMALRATAAQSANMFEIQDSSQNIIVSIGSAGATVWNEQGSDVDYRIEGDTNQNLFFLDASADSIGIGTSSPARLLHVSNTAGSPAIRLTGAASGSPSIEFEQSGNVRTVMGYHNTSTTFQIAYGANFDTTFMAINSSGNVGINNNNPSKKLSVTGDISLDAAGNGIYIKEGSNATMGTATLSGGTIVVSTTKVTANSRIFLTVNGGTLTNVGAVYVSARSAGTSFTITSLNVLDASNVAWLIVEPT